MLFTLCVPPMVRAVRARQPVPRSLQSLCCWFRGLGNGILRDRKRGIQVHVKVFETSDGLARAAAHHAATVLNDAVQIRGGARLLLSTGASQIEVLKYLVEADVKWDVIKVFHLDEYLGLDATHPASFRKYIQERVENLVHPNRVHYVTPDDDVTVTLRALAEEVSLPIDVALVGIGENGHIAFNDPPADFTTQEAYIVVHLDERCKRQQVREGWFRSLDEVPNQAITMTPYQILQSKVIISCVPFSVKAQAVKQTLEMEETNHVPATILKRHPNATLYLDAESASLVDRNKIPLGTK